MRGRNVLITIMAIVIVMLVGLLVFEWNEIDSTKSTDKHVSTTSQKIDGVDDSVFQAVFLNNNQVYFGHLSSNTNKDYVLTDVYYLGDDKNTLVKLGSEPHQPQDKMTIPVASVSFWENLQHANQFNGRLR